MEEQKKSRKSFAGVLSLCLTVLFSLVFLFSGYKIVSYLLEGKEESDLNDEMIREGVERLESEPIYAEDVFTSDFASSSEASEKKILYYPDISVDVSKLSKEYNGMIGWIYLPETPIHYPVMQWTDNDYFVYRMPNGKENSAGSIFMDCRNDAKLSGWNYILYGHNMKNNSMFGTVLDYRDPKFFEEHPYLFYFTEENAYRLEIFAGVHTTSDSFVYTFPEETDEISSYISRIRSNSVFYSSVSVQPSDKVFVLSTCSGRADDDQRFVILAKLVPLEL